MNNITTQLSDKELTDLGRAMERTGFSSPEEYFRWAVMNQTQQALATSGK